MDEQNVVPFPDLFASIDTHIEAIDAIPENEKAKLIKLALQGFGRLMEGQQTEDRAGNLVAAVDGMVLAYLAIGTMLGAKRDLMVKSLRRE